MQYLYLIYLSSFLSLAAEAQSANDLRISGNPAMLIVNSAEAGSQPDIAIVTGTTYNIKTNRSGQKITASINFAMPSNLYLLLRLSPPKNAYAEEYVILTPVAKNVVTNISKVNEKNLGITYGLAASIAAPPQGPLTRVVTFTLSP